MLEMRDPVTGRTVRFFSITSVVWSWYAMDPEGQTILRTEVRRSWKQEPPHLSARGSL